MSLLFKDGDVDHAEINAKAAHEALQRNLGGVPGCVMVDIEDLTEKEISIIREQLAKILE